MDGSQFDTVLQRLTQTQSQSRRGALLGLLGALVGGLGVREAEAKRHKKHKKKPGGSAPVVSCVGQPDLTSCGGGNQCSGGVCATPPNCGVAPDRCASPLDCCGNVCDPVGLTCPLSAPSNPCRTAASCSDGAACVGFVCQ